MNKAKVYYKNLLAGYIKETDEGYEFIYDNSYLSLKECKPISLTLPLKADPYKSNILFPFFDGLIPEGWLLNVAVDYWKIKSNDRFQLLLATCKDAIGAVSILPYNMPNCWFCYKETGSDKEYHERCSKKFFGIDVVPQLQLDEKQLQELAERTINQSISVTGVQPKLSLTLETQKGKPRLTIVGLWGEYILKPQQHQYRAMPETEDLTMHLAKLFKISVCEHALIKTTTGEFVYVAKRFDRIKEEKIHVEDFCQLSEFLTENKYKGSYEKVGKLVLKYCTNYKLDALSYFELLLFAFLTGNNDMHLKNFSIIHLEDSIALSPAYDLLNVNLVNPKDDEELGMTLNGKKKKIKKDDFLKLAGLLGLVEKVVANTFKKFMSNNYAVEDLVSRSFLTPDLKEKYLEIWSLKQKIIIG